VLVIIIVAGIIQKYWFLPRTASIREAIGQNNDQIITPQEVKIDILQQGNGTEAKNGDKLQVYYTGALEDGQEFDSNAGTGKPFTFVLGVGQVIQGWEQGLLGMKIGEKRKLTIPSELGYGKQGSAPKIPPDATLIFNVELVKIN